MKLQLIRKVFTNISIIGDLLIGGDIPIETKHFCYTLEDTIQGMKIPGMTAIPYGTYEVITDYSTRFKRIMPLLLDVPGFTGIRIHAGNDADDTGGCILLGYSKTANLVLQSRAAFNDFMPLLQAGLEEGKVWLTIKKAKTEG